jgi:hypothetical protein
LIALSNGKILCSTETSIILLNENLQEIKCIKKKDKELIF